MELKEGQDFPLSEETENFYSSSSSKQQPHITKFVSSTLLLVGLVSWIMWALGSTERWLLWENCFSIRNAQQYCFYGPAYTLSCCVANNYPQGDDIGCCEPPTNNQSYLDTGSDADGETKSYTRFLLLVQVAFAFAVIGWMVEIFRFTSLFLCCNHRPSAIRLLRLKAVGLVIRAITVILGVIVLNLWTSDADIKLLYDKKPSSPTEPRGTLFTMVGIALDGIIFLVSLFGEIVLQCCCAGCDSPNTNNNSNSNNSNDKIVDPPRQASRPKLEIELTPSLFVTNPGIIHIPLTPKGGGEPSPSFLRGPDDIRRVRDNLLCPICHESYDIQHRIPKLLHCCHTFCLPCIQRLPPVATVSLEVPGAVTPNILCPTCRQCTKIPESGLTSNFALLDILQASKPNYLETTIRRVS